MKIGIGTAQFGLDYGISNREGKTSFNEAKNILKLATQEGVKIIDTASAYGDSEQIIGNILSQMEHNFSIVTKTPHFKNLIINNEDVTFLEETFYNSLTKLKQDSIYGLLIHNADDLLKPNAELLMNKLLELKYNNKIEKIGVSVYNSEQIDAIIDKYPIDLIQLPINVFDQRLIQSGHLTKLKDKGIEIHARSIFLQGLLLMDINTIPVSLKLIYEHLNKYHHFLSINAVSPLQFCIDFIKQISEIDIMICGINNYQQLKEIIESEKKSHIAIKSIEYEQFALDDNKILNPSNWSN